MHFCPWVVYIDFYVKMPLDGCSIPNTCAFIQIHELQDVKDTQTNYFLSENPWVSGWGLTGSRWKRPKICNNSFKLGSELPWVKMFLSDIPLVGQYEANQITLCGSNRPCQNPLGYPQGGGPWEFTLTSALQVTDSLTAALIHCITEKHPPVVEPWLVKILKGKLIFLGT